MSTTPILRRHTPLDRIGVMCDALWSAHARLRQTAGAAG